jgi:signal transduction histidine kinase
MSDRHPEPKSDPGTASSVTPGMTPSATQIAASMRDGYQRVRVPISLRARLRYALWVGLACAALVLLLWSSGMFAGTRLRLQDVYYVPHPTQGEIVIVALDDSSLQAYGRSPAQWSRTLYADLVMRLSEAGARVIAFDLLFAESTPDDLALADALRSAREGETRTRIVMPAVGLRRADGAAQSAGWVTYSEVLFPQRALAEAVDYLGFVNVYPDIDNAVRRQLSLVQYDGERQVAFSLAVYLSYLRIPPAALDQVLVSAPGRLAVTPERSVSVDPYGLWLPYFFGPPSSTMTSSANTFPVLPMRAVLDGEVDPAIFNDKIVLIGVINSTGFNDQHAVPSGVTGRLMSGIEIHANAIESLLQNTFPYEQPVLNQAVMLVALSMIAALIYGFMRWYVILLTAPLLVIGWAVIAFLNFQARMELINLFHASLSLLIPGVASLALHVMREAERRRRSEWLLTNVSALYTETRRQKATLEALIAGSPAGIMLLDDQRALTRANDAASAALEIELTGYMGRTWDDLIKAAALDDALQTRLRDSFADRAPFRHDVKRGGKHYALDAAPLPENGGWVVILNDVSALAELSILKTRMIRMASHDLKNPLTNILVIARLVEDNPDLGANDEQVRSYMTRLVEAAYLMNDIIDHVLKLERAKAGEIERFPVFLGELVAAAVHQQQTTVDSKQQTMTMDIADNLPFVLGDSQQLMQAISNLVGNAVKYTPDGGQVSVRLMLVNDKLHLEVQDTGYGIPQAAQEKLFQEFYRVRTPDTIHIPGTGLGLSLVKSVVETHKGRVWLKSDEGKGSTFYVELPAMALEREQV